MVTHRLASALACLAALSLMGPGQASHLRAEQQPPTQSQAGQQTQQPPTQPQAGQPAQQQPPTFRAGVNLVRVDVTVLGKGDRPVADLKAEDFEILEDGAPQKIQTMQFLRLDGQPPPGDDESLEIRSQEHAEAEAARDDVRVFVLFLDDYHIDHLPVITMPLRRGLTDFITRLQPTDLVAIVDPLTPLSALRFTRAKDQLIDVIRQFEGRQNQVFPVRSAAEEAQLQSGDVGRLRSQVTLSALEALAIRLGGLKEGRKTIIFVSQGPRTYFSSGSLEDDMRGVIQAANRSNVTIHVLDPRGLAGPGSGALDTLFRLANETGGRTIVRTNDFDAGLREVMADASAYYLLGYAPSRPEQDDGKYHKITVHVKRPGMRILARQGYFAPSRKEIETAVAAAHRPEVPGVSGAMRMLALLAPRGPVQSWVGFSRNGQGDTVATLTWEPSGMSLDKPVSGVEVEVVPGHDKAASGPPHVLPAPTPASPARPRDSFVVAPGNLLLRFVARAEDGTPIDRWEQQWMVPDLRTPPVSLATPRFHRTISLAEVRALQAGADPVPTAVRTFHQTDRVFVDVECYTAAPSPAPAATAFLLSADGKPLLDLQLPALANGKSRVEIPVRALGKGTYLVRILARTGAVGAQQVVAFQVEP
jgi:VWFA-related protein